ncbi:lysoplasmalogenase [Sphingobacterium kyonggiense]
MRNLIFHILFAAIFLVHLASIYWYWDDIRFFTKPLICLCLIVLLSVNTGLKSKFHRLIAFGLVFGLLGDIFLMLHDLFIPGLVSFLIGHILYIWAFLLQYSEENISKNKYVIVILTFLAIYSFNLYKVLSPSLGSLKIPVIAYILVIATMALFAYTRKNKTTFWSFLYIFLGALFFIASDSLLAINKFVAYVPNSALMIMSTYMLAQYLITVGSTKHQPRIS